LVKITNYCDSEALSLPGCYAVPVDMHEASRYEMVSSNLPLPLSRFKIFYSAHCLQNPRSSVLPFILWL